MAAPSLGVCQGLLGAGGHSGLGGECWGQQGAEGCFAPGVEQQLLGGGRDSMCGDREWEQKLLGASQSGSWGVLGVYSGGGADGAGTPGATAEYDWLVGGTDGQALEIWAEGAATVCGPPKEVDSTRAGLV